MMDYVTKHSLRGSKGRMCYDKYGDMVNFANEMMKFRKFAPKDPLNTDFSQLDSTAKAELLKVWKMQRLLENNISKRHFMQQRMRLLLI